MIDDRRLRRLDITPETFLTLCRGRYAVVQSPLPADATIVAIGADATRYTLYVILRHPSFDPVTEGDIIPSQPAPTIHRLPEEDSP